MACCVGWRAVLFPDCLWDHQDESSGDLCEFSNAASQDLQQCALVTRRFYVLACGGDQVSAIMRPLGLAPWCR